MYFISKLIFSTFIFTILISCFVILGIFFLTKEVKSQNICSFNPVFSELKIIIGENKKDGRFLTYSYEFK